MSGANVAILLTPPGTAAIAVVRLSGDRVAHFLGERFSRPTPDGRCVHGTLRDEAGDVLDDPIVVCSRGGTVADVNLHGGAWVVAAVLALAGRAGFQVDRWSTPAGRAGFAADEASASALATAADEASGEMEREVLRHLPRATTERALRTLLAQPRAWACAKPRLTPGDLRAILADRSLDRLLNPARVAIVGAANVGKSTLANQLFARERSITADVPGTTRDWVGELANLDGVAVTLVDTPGVRETIDEIEREAIERSGVEVRRADVVVVVLDATRPLEPEQGPLLRRHPRSVVVANKIDRVPGWKETRVDASTVATTGEGVPEMRQAILAALGCGDAPPDQPRVWTERQRILVERAIADAQSLADL